MVSILAASFASVLRVLLVCGAGAWLSHRGILNRDCRHRLSRVILLVMLPGLLVAKLSQHATAANLAAWLAIPAAAPCYVVLGLAAGVLVCRLFRPPADTHRSVVAATAFGNSGYVPISMVTVIAATAPVFAGDPGAADRGIAYVSVYLVVFSPCLWGIGYPLLSGAPLRSLKCSQLLSPPVLSAGVGILIGACTPLRSLFVERAAPLRVLMDAAELLGRGAIPCGLMVLGANLADARGAAGRVPGRAIIGVCLARFVVLPLIGCAGVVLLARAGWLVRDPMFAFVLLIESTVPPATNLVVMSQLHRRGEAEMAGLLFWTHIAAAMVLTFTVSLFLWLAGNLWASPAV